MFFVILIRKNIKTVDDVLAYFLGILGASIAMLLIVYVKRYLFRKLSVSINTVNEKVKSA